MAPTLEPQLPCPFPSGNTNFARRILVELKWAAITANVRPWKLDLTGTDSARQPHVRMEQVRKQTLGENGYLIEYWSRPTYLPEQNKILSHILMDQSLNQHEVIKVIHLSVQLTQYCSHMYSVINTDVFHPSKLGLRHFRRWQKDSRVNFCIFATDYITCRPCHCGWFKILFPIHCLIFHPRMSRESLCPAQLPLIP